MSNWYKESKKKKTLVDPYVIDEDGVMKYRLVDGTLMVAEDESAELEKEGKDWDPNPWAVCTDSVGRDDKEKYEKCVQEVKRNQKKSEMTPAFKR